jgi:hypothetical protein
MMLGAKDGLHVTQKRGIPLLQLMRKMARFDRSPTHHPCPKFMAFKKAPEKTTLAVSVLQEDICRGPFQTPPLFSILKLNEDVILLHVKLSTILTKTRMPIKVYMKGTHPWNLIQSMTM